MQKEQEIIHDCDNPCADRKLERRSRDVVEGDCAGYLQIDTDCFDFSRKLYILIPSGTLCPIAEEQADALAVVRPADAFRDGRANIDRYQL